MLAEHLGAVCRPCRGSGYVTMVRRSQHVVTVDTVLKMAGSVFRNDVFGNGGCND